MEALTESFVRRIRASLPRERELICSRTRSPAALCQECVELRLGVP
jgi:hypothetical protein